MNISQWVVAVAAAISATAWLATVPRAVAWLRVDRPARRRFAALHAADPDRADELLAAHNKSHSFAVYAPTCLLAVVAIPTLLEFTCPTDSTAVLTWPIDAVVAAVLTTLISLGVLASPKPDRPAAETTPPPAP